MSNFKFSVNVKGRKAAVYRRLDENYIEGRRGSEYTLKFTNDSYERVLVVCSVDGLSVMDGKPASEDSGGYVVEAYQTIDIKGWRIDDHDVAKFQFRPFGDKDDPTYVEELKKEGFDVDEANRGVIGVLVFNRGRDHYHPYAFGFNTSLRASGTCSSSWDLGTQNLGTGFGETTEFHTQEVEFVRQKRPAWSHVIHYDTLEGLRQRGVIVEKSGIEAAFPKMKQSTGCYVPSSRRN